MATKHEVATDFSFDMTQMGKNAGPKLNTYECKFRAVWSQLLSESVTLVFHLLFGPRAALNTPTSSPSGACPGFICFGEPPDGSRFDQRKADNRT